MGHRVPAMQAGRGLCIFARGAVAKRKSRQKWRNRTGRFQDTQFQRRDESLLHRYGANHPPKAPRNTTSYIIHSKSMGDAMHPVVTPSPFTSAVLPTPGPLPRYKEQFSEEAKEWGLNGYGSMNGLIRRKARIMESSALVAGEDEDDEGEEGKEENVGNYAESLEKLEQRLDHGLNKFEMVYPCVARQEPPLNVLLVDQEHHIAQLEEENITLKERLSLIERELGDLRSRIHVLEGRSDQHGSGEMFSEKSIGTQHPS